MPEPQATETIFAALFFTANRLQAQADKYLSEHNITSRQWLLLAVIAKSPGNICTIGQAAKILCTSHQNIKQMASLLEKNGWIEWFVSPDDRRRLYMKQTELCKGFWQKREKQDLDYLNQLFSIFSGEEKTAFASFLMRFYASMGGEL